MKQPTIDRLKSLTPESRILFITGAGISVDSGLPTYRGVAGLYDNENTEDGVPIEVALSGGMFARKPLLTWKYLLQIANACQGKTCNRGHQVISEIESRFRNSWVLTQNIDGFHRDAGSKNLIEIHGSMREMRCTSCSYSAATADYQSQVPTEELIEKGELPSCPKCNHPVRPAVVLFDEMLPERAVASLSRELETGFDTIVVVGTTAVFPYISQPVYSARFNNCLTIEINPGETDLSDHVDEKLSVGATDGLQAVLDCLEN